MRQKSERNHPPASNSGAFEALAQAVEQAQPPPSPNFVALLQMRSTDRFANQNIARQLELDPEFHANLQIVYAASRRSSRLANAPSAPNQRPLSAREAVDHWGYRRCHTTCVASAIANFLGNEAFAPAHHQYWLRAFAIASYAGIHAEAFATHEDHAFAGSLLRSVGLFLLMKHDPANADAAARLAVRTQSPLWDAETELLGGSHLDLARRVCNRAALSSELLEAFNPQDQPGSLPNLLFRATATAERHGFEDPEHPLIPPALRPRREPLLDLFFRNSGSTPAGVFLHISAMLANTPLRDIVSAA